jgi:lipopolysaccharide/colanic/teichoic acid biosynthesis glycosyltransferase
MLMASRNVLADLPQPPETAWIPFPAAPDSGPGWETRPVVVIVPATWYVAVKGVADFLLAVVLLILAAPVILVCGLLVRLTSPGPALYTQVRLGQRGRPFRIFKLRTMRTDSETVGGAQWSRPGDPRVTFIGRLLRRTHLDELPQLWNVLKGDMSLVGPRPERPEFVPGLEQALPGYRNRLLVKPGVTGLAQVQLPPDTDVHSVRRKLAYDLHYLARIGVWLDLRLILCTAFHMLGVPYATLGRLFLLPRPESTPPLQSAVASATSGSVALPSQPTLPNGRGSSISHAP